MLFTVFSGEGRTQDQWNHRFGKVRDGEMVLTDAGQIAANEWKDIPNHYSNITLDSRVVMPNHIHGIITILHPTPVGAATRWAIHELPPQHFAKPELLIRFLIFSVVPEIEGQKFFRNSNSHLKESHRGTNQTEYSGISLQFYE